MYKKHSKFKKIFKHKKRTKKPIKNKHKYKQNQHGGMLINIKSKMYEVTIPDELKITQDSINHRGKGAGPFGEVYKGTYNGIPVAIKFLKKQSVESIEDEITNYKLASEYGFGPKIYYSYCCNKISYQQKNFMTKTTNTKYEYIGYIVMELLTNAMQYIQIQKDNNISLEIFLQNIDTQLSILAHKIYKQSFIFMDVNFGNFGFRNETLLLLDLETLRKFDNMTATEENFKKFLGGSLIYEIKSKYKTENKNSNNLE